MTIPTEPTEGTGSMPLMTIVAIIGRRGINTSVGCSGCVVMTSMSGIRSLV